MHSTILAVAAFAAGAFALPATPSAIVATGLPIVGTIFPTRPLSLLPVPSPTKGIVLPSPISMGATPTATFSPAGQAIIENAACDLNQNLFPGEPLFQVFGVAQFIGDTIGPSLNKTFGADFLNDIDITADQLCVSAEQEPDDGLGVCQTALAALFDLSNHLDPSGVAAFQCFLSLACVAPTGFNHTGTCQELLAGSDCIANRILDELAPECCPVSNPNCGQNPTN